MRVLAIELEADPDAFDTRLAGDAVAAAGAADPPVPGDLQNGLQPVDHPAAAYVLRQPAPGGRSRGLRKGMERQLL